MDQNYIAFLKEQIENLENQLFELKAELKEKEGYQNLEDLNIPYWWYVSSRFYKINYYKGASYGTHLKIYK